MSITRYIVDNVSGQTISEINSTIINTDTISATNYLNLPIPTSISSGPSAPGSAVVANDTDVDINFSDGIGTAWSFSPTGMTFPDDTIQSTAYEPKYKVYTALLTQSGGDDPQELVGSGLLTIGVTYRISDNASNPDFTNVGAPNNDYGTMFVATGTTPTSWGEATLEYNTGAPVVTVLENTIGNIWFTYDSGGYYYMYSDGLFTINKTYAPSIIINGTPTIVTFIANGNINIIDFIVNEGDGVLFNTPIEIRVYN